ncbi:MAG: YerC/YecD family TrpR-related protein [Bacillota bacterium]
MGYTGKLRDPLIDKLFDAILTLKNRDECYMFFDDLCTVAEIKAMAQRLEAAKMLAAGKTYDEIAAATGMSTATISRIKRYLLYGSDGYKLVISRLNGSAGQ